MALSGMRVTLKMRLAGLAITETHVYIPSIDFDVVAKAAKELMAARMALSGFPTEPVAIRMSVEGKFRRTKSIGANQLAKLAPREGIFKTDDGESFDNTSDQPKSCVLVRAFSNDVSAKNIFLSGVPDIVIREAPEGPAIVQVPGWDKLWKRYRTILVNGKWGFIGQSDPVGNLAPREVLSAQNDQGSSLLAIITQVNAQNYVPGQLVKLHGFKRINTAYPKVDGKYKVKTVTPNADTGQTYYTLGGTKGAWAAFITQTGTVQLVDYSALVYTDMDLAGQTTRKRGNRTLAQPGRRSTKKYLAI